VKPDGFLYEIPVRIKLLESIRPTPAGLQLPTPTTTNTGGHTNAESNKPVIDQAVAPTANTTAKIKVATSKSILFFGRALNPRNQTQTDGLTNDLTIKNLNEFSIRYNIVAYSLDSEAETKPGRSVFSLFKFTPEMYSAAECCNRVDNGKMTRLTIDLQPQQEICLRLRFDPSVAENEFGPELVQNGVIKISAVGFSERFNVYLVGFLNK
jgi:hypothetical protein